MASCDLDVLADPVAARLSRSLPMRPGPFKSRLAACCSAVGRSVNLAPPGRPREEGSTAESPELLRGPAAGRQTGCGLGGGSSLPVLQDGGCTPPM